MMMQSLIDEIPDSVWSSFWHGLELATATIVATALLELYSIDTARALYKKDRDLYLQGILLNFLNHYIYGIPVYIFAVVFFSRQHKEDISSLVIFNQYLGILIIHSFCYYSVHKQFHRSPVYYKYHKFHHRFNTHVPPVAANAVGFVEYLFAYVAPFALACALVHPHEIALRAAVTTISSLNLLIHTPKWEAWSERVVPACWVSTHDHLEHHRKLNCHYAAPTFNLDWVVDQIRNPGDQTKID